MEHSYLLSNSSLKFNPVKRLSQIFPLLWLQKINKTFRSDTFCLLLGILHKHFLTEVQLQKKDLCFGTGNENKIGILCLQKRNLFNASTYWFGFLGV